MSVVSALYLVLLAAVAGYVLVARVPSLLHTPMLSGSNFIHGIVLLGSMLALSSASGALETVIGFLVVMAASANVVGGFVVTDRMLNLFEKKGASATSSLLSRMPEPATVNNAEQPAGAGSRQSEDSSSSISASNGEQ